MKPRTWSFREWFWYRVIVFATRGSVPRLFGACANRILYTCWFGPLEMSIVIRNTREPDGYSREELVAMLDLVRKYEKKQGWTVPEKLQSGPF
jgi:hypothetical protein